MALHAAGCHALCDLAESAGLAADGRLHVSVQRRRAQDERGDGAGALRSAVLPARHADQPRPDPPGCERGVGPGAARHRDLQLPARRPAAVGVGYRHPRPEDQPRRHRLCDARLHERRDRQHSRELGRSQQGARGRARSAAAAASSSTTSTTSSGCGSSSAACRWARPSPIRSASSSCWCATAISSARKSSTSEPLKNQCADFVNAILTGTPAAGRRPLRNRRGSNAGGDRHVDAVARSGS